MANSMAQYHLAQALYVLVMTLVASAVLVFDCMMIAEVRRKRLTQLLGWLVPATISATIAIIVYLLSDLRLILGLRETVSFYEFAALLGGIAGIITSWAAFRLWQMVCQLPFRNQPEVEQDASGEGPGVWPPPPVSRT